MREIAPQKIRKKCSFGRIRVGFFGVRRKTAICDQVELVLWACHGQGRSYGGRIRPFVRVVDRRHVERVVDFKKELKNDAI